MDAWTREPCSCSSAACSPRASCVALGAARTGLPVLVAFLALGMLLGSDGPGGIEFDDAELAREVGTVGLALILYEGGLQTSWRRLREVVVPAALLSTVGVVVSSAPHRRRRARACSTSRWLEAILLGAVVASTDAAAVFATLRSTHIRRRLARTLEAESGGNDPMAIALTLGLIAWIEQPGRYGFGDLVAARRPADRARAAGRRRARRGRHVGVRAPPDVDRGVRPGRLARGGRALVRRRRRDRRQRLPRGLPRRASPSAARRRATARQLVGLPRGRRLPRAGRAVHRARAARLPARAADVALAGLGARPAPRAASSGRPRSGRRPRSATSRTRERAAARLGRPARRRARSCSRRSCSPRTSRTGETIFNAVFFVVSSRRSCRARRSSGSPGGSSLLSRRRRSAEPPLEVGARSKLDAGRVRRRRRPRDRRLGRARARPAARRAIVAVVERGDDSIPPRGSTRHRARRPALRPRAARPAAGGRGRLLALAPPDLNGCRETYGVSATAASGEATRKLKLSSR